MQQITERWELVVCSVILSKVYCQKDTHSIQLNSIHLYGAEYCTEVVEYKYYICVCIYADSVHEKPELFLLHKCIN